MKIELGTHEKQNYDGSVAIVKDILNIEASHYNGVYTMYCTKQSVEGMWTTTIPYANGNFRATLGTGRKSQKKLEKLNTIIDNKADELLNLWKNEDYHGMVRTVTSETSKLF